MYMVCKVYFVYYLKGTIIEAKYSMGWNKCSVSYVHSSPQKWLTFRLASFAIHSSYWGLGKIQKYEEKFPSTRKKGILLTFSINIISTFYVLILSSCYPLQHLSCFTAERVNSLFCICCVPVFPVFAQKFSLQMNIKIPWTKLLMVISAICYSPHKTLTAECFYNV